MDSVSIAKNTIDDDLKFNPYSKEYRANPYLYYKKLREYAPIMDIGNDTYLVSRYQDIKSILSQKSMSVRHIPNTISELSNEYKPGLHELGRLAVVFTDPPEHSRLRKLMNKAFNRSAITEFTLIIDEEISHILSDKINVNEFDFVAEVSHKVPLNVVSRLLGVADKDIPMLDEKLSFLRQTLDPTLYTSRRINKFEEALSQCMAYFEALIESNKLSSNDNLLTKLIASRIEDDQLTPNEMIIGCVLTYIAGHETTKAVIATGIYNLASHPDQWLKLKQQPELLDQTIEEILRIDPPLMKTMRIVNEDMEIAGESVAKGSKLLINIASACHDEAIYPSPSEFNIERAYVENIAFGFGMHNCIGKYLAKAEVKSVLKYLLAHAKEVRLKNGYEPSYEYLGITARTLSHLMLKLKG